MKEVFISQKIDWQMYKDKLSLSNNKKVLNLGHKINEFEVSKQFIPSSSNQKYYFYQSGFFLTNWINKSFHNLIFKKTV